MSYKNIFSESMLKSGLKHTDDSIIKYFRISSSEYNCESFLTIGAVCEYLHKLESMRKYYKICINSDNSKQFKSEAMYQLGNYYETIEKNEELMMKYYLMAKKLDNRKAIIKLENLIQTKI